MVQLRKSLLRANTKLVVLEGATGPLRMYLERSFQKDVTQLLRLWYRKLSQFLFNSGILGGLQQQKFLVRRSNRSLRSYKNAVNILIESTLSSIRSDIESMPEVGRASEIHLRWSKAAYDLGAVTSLQSLGLDATSNIVSKLSKKVSKADKILFALTVNEIIFALEDRSVQFGKGLAISILEDARRIIRDELFLGDKESQGVAYAIANSSKLTLSRALRIARTETQAAYNTAAYEMYERSNVLRNMWITVGDRRVRPEHVLNEADGWVPLGQPFSSGQLHPGDGVLSINCRCSLIPDLADPRILLIPWSGGN